MVREYVIDLAIDRPRLLRFYRGSANAVQGIARGGLRLRLPLSCLRPYVTPMGVHGTFRLRVDEHRRLRSIERLDTAIS